jgi:hypothetical protein
MKQKFRTIASVVALITMTVFAASCAKEELSEKAQNHISGVKRTISASASLPQTADKAHLDEYDNVIWDLGDAININGNNITISSIGSTGRVAVFDKSTAYAIPSGDNDIYWAVYPATLAESASGGIIPDNFTTSSLEFTLPATQIYDISANVISGNTYMAAFASVPAGQADVSFAMKNLGSVMHLRLTADAGASNKHITQIVFSSTGKLSGKFTTNTTFTTVTPDITATTTLTVQLKNGSNNYIDISSPKDIYVVLPAIEAQKITMRVYNEEECWIEKTANSMTLERSKIYHNVISDAAFDKKPLPLGPFSINSSGGKVYFSPGNLQWSATGGGTTPTTHAVAGGGTDEGTWRFAEHQWDIVGHASKGTVYANGVKCNNALVSQNYTGWLDLFCWGTSGWNSGAVDCHPYSCSSVLANHYPGGDYNNSLVGSYANADWGVYNAIYNTNTWLTDAPGKWRTLTKDEWVYLVSQRTDYLTLRARASVNGIEGLILLPDNWTLPAGLSLTTGVGTSVINEYTTEQWAIMEAAGAAFLPTAGTRNGQTNVYDLGERGRYWSTTSYDSKMAYYLYFYPGVVDPQAYYSRAFWDAWSVRLVRDAN